MCYEKKYLHVLSLYTVKCLNPENGTPFERNFFELGIVGSNFSPG